MKKKEYPCIVFDKQTNKYAGSTSFYDIQQTWFTAQPLTAMVLLGVQRQGRHFNLVE